MACSYCGRNTCHRCVRQLQFQLMRIMDALEQLLLQPDQIDVIGINDHLRAAWGARDAINDLCSLPPCRPPDPRNRDPGFTI